MTAKPDKTWAGRFRQLFAGHLNALSERNIKITSAQRALIRSATTMELELETLARKFALKTGASHADLSMFAKISAAMQGMFASVGLGHEPVPQIVVNNNVTVREDDGARAAIALALTKLIEARREREANSVIIDAQANPEPIAADPVETKPGQVERDVRDDVKIIRLPVARAGRAVEPPVPTEAPKSSTELYLENPNAGRPWWGPVGDGSKP